MRRAIITLVLLGVAVPWLTVAQVQTPTGQKSLAATMNVYVFPKEGQDATQQSKDEAECYSWAVSNVGTDPFELGKQSEQQRQQTEQAKRDAKEAGKGAGAKGALGGAAAGALVGEIASDDPGKGAAYGAAVGLIAGRRHRKSSQKEAVRSAEAQGARAQQATAEQLENFKKAFSICLEAKDYLVKY